MSYPGARCLFLRQTKASMAQSTLNTFERDVIYWPSIANPDPGRANRMSYQYKNGSEIVIGGLDDVGKFLSTEYDFIAVFQAEECAEEPVMTLLTRLNNFVVPFQQMALDVNPKSPNHWVKKMCDGPNAKATMIHGSIKDNPKYWNSAAQNWTPEGESLMSTLENLTGHLYDRYVLGRWVAPEGARFSGASRERQGFVMKDVFPQGMPSWWPRWLSVDYGKADPYACYWHARDDNGHVWTYLEDYATGYEADQQAARIIERSPRGEVYEGIWMDQSMFRGGDYARPFGAQNGKSAAEQYKTVLEEELVKVQDGDRDVMVRKFGTLHAARQNRNEDLYITLDSMLRNGTWHIERGCSNLWNEIEDAVHYKDPRTGVVSELINPHQGKKDCSDHGLEAAAYGICRNIYPATSPEVVIDYAAIMTTRQKEHAEHFYQIHGNDDNLL